MSRQSMTIDQINYLIEEFRKVGVFHVILNGGEPFCSFGLLKHAIERCKKQGFSISLNSNLMLAKESDLKTLYNLGLDHILTSLNSYDSDTNDFMLSSRQTLPRIIKGITMARKVGIRISANMIVSRRNKDHVYRTGFLAHELGCTKFFATRPVVSFEMEKTEKVSLVLERADVVRMLDELLRLHGDSGISVGSLVNIPLCLLGDLEKYKYFVGRGCPTQSGHLFTINATGEASACCRESAIYGNVFKDGLIGVWRKTHKWHNEGLWFKGCSGCECVDLCQTGCRMNALGYSGDIAGQDPLMVGPQNITRKYSLISDTNIFDRIRTGASFTVPKRLRFRKEDGFYLVSIRWANIITVDNQTAKFLMDYQVSQGQFTIKEFGGYNHELLAQLYFKDAVESNEMVFEKIQKDQGVSVDLTALPQ